MEPKDFKRRLLGAVDAESLLEIFEHLPGVGFWVKDREGRIAANNQVGVLRKPGCYSEDEVIGRTDMDFFPREMAARFVADDRAVAASGARMTERLEYLLNRDGSLVLHRTVKVPLRDRGGQVIGSAGITVPQGGSREGFAAAPQLGRAVDRMRGKLDDPPSIGQLARLANLSVRQFERRFKQELGATPKQFLLQIRMEAACKALATTRSSIKQIAAATGFSGAGVFVTRFKSLLNLTPGEYRKRYGSRAEGSPAASP